MNSRIVFSIALVFGAGCSPLLAATTAGVSPSSVLTAASTCAGQVLDTAKGKSGKTVLTSLSYAKIWKVEMGSSAQGGEKILAVPYVTATALDNGVPGSTWRMCMQKEHMPVPH